MDVFIGLVVGVVLTTLIIKYPPKVGWLESFNRYQRERRYAVEYLFLKHPDMTHKVASLDDMNVPFRAIYMPILRGLKPTRESTYIKLGEELGEISEILGKFGGLSGECTKITQKELDDMLVKELLDLTQVCFTYINVLEEGGGLDVTAAIKEHVCKLIGKGYIK